MELGILIVRNAKNIAKHSSNFTARFEAFANIIDSRLSEDEKYIKTVTENFNSQKNKMDEHVMVLESEQKDLKIVSQILTENGRKLSHDLRALEVNSGKATQILEDKLTLPIHIQGRNRNRTHTNLVPKIIFLTLFYFL
jgi:hypothetical protein